MKPFKASMPETRDRINAALAEHGYRADDMVDMDMQMLRDDERGVFMRLTLKLSDGSTFELDTLEISTLITPLFAN